MLASGLYGFLGVAGGSLGAHWLKEILDPGDLNTFEIGIRYQMYHALALLATGLVSVRWRNRLFGWACGLFIAGIFFFSGSLYLLAFTGIGAFGAVAPLGGCSLMAGWATLTIAALRAKANTCG